MPCQAPYVVAPYVADGIEMLVVERGERDWQRLLDAED